MFVIDLFIYFRMSTQRGSTKRTRPQKHQNRTSFKNNLHDTSHQTKLINNIQISDVCVRCKEIIEWKIKYKKYKPLGQPKKCVKCEQRTVKNAYHVMCLDCGRKLEVCTKCCKAKELVVAAGPDQKEQIKLDNELQNLLQTLSERKRRSFLRYMDKEKSCSDVDLHKKISALQVEDSDEEEAN